MVIALCATVLVLVMGMPTSYAILMPGPTIDAREMLLIPDSDPQQQGGLLLTTVAVAPRVNMLNLLHAAFVSSASAVPREAVIPSEWSLQKLEELGRREMDESRAAAVAAASRHLGVPVQVRGAGVEITALTDAPQHGLSAGDVIVQVGPHHVRTIWDLADSLHNLTPGGNTRLVVVSGDSLRSVELPVGRDSRGDPTLGVRGTTVSPRVATSTSVAMAPGDFIGPSAGLMLAIATVERLSRQSLTAGHIVAGTGTMAPSGAVGPIGGVTQKVFGAEQAGAEFFLVPVANYREAARAASQMKVVPVASLAEALVFLESLPQGR